LIHLRVLEPPGDITKLVSVYLTLKGGKMCRIG
jgi:hypothetical protein